MNNTLLESHMTQKNIHDEQKDPFPVPMPTQDRIRIFANIIVDRILELQKSKNASIELKNV